MLKTARFALFFSVLASGQAFAQGDAAKGEKIFARCAACHEVKEATNKIGPYLKGVVGRPIATAEGYNYSNAMKAFAKTAGVWDEKNLDTYLSNPREVVKGTKMALGPMKKADERADLIAYLKTMTP